MKTFLFIVVFVAAASLIHAAETNKSERVEKQSGGVESVLRDYAEGTLKLEDLYEDDRAPLRKRIISYFDTVTNRMPLNYTYVVACCMGKEGDFKRAAKLAEAYVAVYTNDWRGWRILGTACAMMDQHQRALDAYAKAVKLGDEESCSSLGGEALELNRLDVIRELVPQLMRIKNSEEPPKFVKLEIVGLLAVYARRADAKEVFVKALEGVKIEDILSRDDIAAAVDKACKKFQAPEVDAICQKLAEAMRRKNAEQKK